MVVVVVVVVVDAFDEALSVPCIEGSGIHIANTAKTGLIGNGAK